MRCSCGINRLYRCIAAVCLLGLLLSFSAEAQVGDIPDANLAGAVCDALGFSTGGSVTAEAMSWLEILRAQSDTSSGKSGNSYTNEEKYVK